MAYESEPKGADKNKFNIAWIVVIGVLVVAGIVIWFYKDFQIANVREEADQNLVDQQLRYESALVDVEDEYSRQLVKPLVWAVRSEMLRENYEEVNRYLTEFVRQKDYQNLAVANAEGQIVVATDKKMEGAELGDFYPAEYNQVNEVKVDRQENRIVTVAPVMGLNSRLGTLVMVKTGAELPQAEARAAVEE